MEKLTQGILKNEALTGVAGILFFKILWVLTLHNVLVHV
jgi:hypothetical protein